MKKHLIGFIIVSVAFLMSCTDDSNDNSNNNTSGKYSEGVFIINEGNFGQGNGSLTFYNETTDSTTQDVFRSINDRPLGDVPQSISFHNDLAFIVVNGSNKVEVVDAGTFEEVATITGFGNPRYFLGITDDKAYVSQWGADGVSGNIQIIDLNTYTIAGSINTTGIGVGKMEMIDGKVYAGHGGGYGIDNNFVVINPTTNEIINNITVEVNPNDFAVDKNGLIWVLSTGHFDPATNSKLIAYNPSDLSIAKEFELNANYPADLHIDASGDKLYFVLGGEILEMDVDNDALNLSTFANASSYYSLGYDAEDGEFYAGDAGDFASQGLVQVFDESGDLIKTIEAGITPGDIVIK